MKRTLLVAGILLMAITVSACSFSKKKDKDQSEGTKNVDVKKVETGGLYYLFDGEKYDACNQILGDIVYQKPDTQTILRGNAELCLLSADKQILVNWFNQKGTATGSKDILTNCSKDIIKDLALDLGIDEKGVTFMVNADSTTTVNNIERTRYSGTIVCYTLPDKKQLELNTVIYTFVVNGKPGCVMGIVTDKKQTKKYQDEIDNNTQVLMNTIVVKQ